MQQSLPAPLEDTGRCPTGEKVEKELCLFGAKDQDPNVTSNLGNHPLRLIVLLVPLMHFIRTSLHRSNHPPTWRTTSVLDSLAVLKLERLELAWSVVLIDSVILF
jgi:hypothetical protein